MRPKRGAIAECGNQSCAVFLLDRQGILVDQLRKEADAAWVKYSASRADEALLWDWNMTWDKWLAQYKHLYVIRARIDDKRGRPRKAVTQRPRKAA